MALYNDTFYARVIKETENSARNIIDCFMSHYDGQINSAVDLGCGVGVFLGVVKEKCGAKKIKGVDGAYVNKELLHIEKSEFTEWNLEKSFRDTERYDLAISTEVAEHLPEERADSFVEDLTSLADIVLFSAALPYQGGTNHINEQLLSYWVEKFDKRGYEFRDIIRPDIWYSQDVVFYYKSNMAVFVKKDSESAIKLDKVANNVLVDVVNPDMYKYRSMLTTGRLGRAFVKVEHFFDKIRSRKNNK